MSGILTESASVGHAGDNWEVVDADIGKLFFPDLPKEAECSEIIMFCKTVMTCIFLSLLLLPHNC